MTLLRLAWLNTLRHKAHSGVLLLVFSLTTFILFWVFGFINFAGENLKGKLYASYGDVVYYTSFFEREKILATLKNVSGIKNVVAERELKAMADSSKKNMVISLSELTKENQTRLLPYLKPLKGKLPEANDEICTTNFIEDLNYEIGDVIYVTTTTANNIINTIRYRVSCVLQRNAYKNMGIAYLISETSMDELTASKSQANVLYYFLDPNFKNEKAIESLLQNKGIKVDKKVTYQEKLGQMKIDFTVFKSLKFIICLFLLPPLAVILSILLLMNVYKRRGEIWTHSSLGLAPLELYKLIFFEHLFLLFSGFCIGGLFWYLTLSIVRAKNYWLSFSYAYSGPLDALFSLEQALIFLFMYFVLVALAIKKPIYKIINEIPFSY